MKKILFICLLISGWTFSQSFPPSAGVTGTTAISKDSSILIDWATGCMVTRGFLNISDTTFLISGSNKASFGIASNAEGIAEGNSADVVSLGDKGEAILTFSSPIIDGVGFDFAVFENSLNSTFLELAHVEVSTDGINYVRFSSTSETSIIPQVGTFGSLDAPYLNNLAGKYQQGYGVGFDLNELAGNPLLDISNINFIKIIDVVGSIDENFGTHDGQNTLINDPFPTPFESGGFDLDAIGVIHNQNEVLVIEEHTRNFVQIYPNPSKGGFTLQFKDVEEAQVELFTLDGRLVYFQNLNSNQLHYFIQTTLPNGHYILKLQSKTITISKSIVIQ